MRSGEADLVAIARRGIFVKLTSAAMSPLTGPPLPDRRDGVNRIRHANLAATPVGYCPPRTAPPEDSGAVFNASCGPAQSIVSTILPTCRRFHAGMRLGCPDKREHRVDHRLQPALGDELLHRTVQFVGKRLELRGRGRSVDPVSVSQRA